MADLRRDLIFRLAFRELAQGICFAEGFPRNLAFAFTHYLSERPENEAKQQDN